METSWQASGPGCSEWPTRSPAFCLSKMRQRTVQGSGRLGEKMKARFRRQPSPLWLWDAGCADFRVSQGPPPAIWSRFPRLWSAVPPNDVLARHSAIIYWLFQLKKIYKQSKNNKLNVKSLTGNHGRLHLYTRGCWLPNTKYETVFTVRWQKNVQHPMIVARKTSQFITLPFF